MLIINILGSHCNIFEGAGGVYTFRQKIPAQQKLLKLQCKESNREQRNEQVLASIQVLCLNSCTSHYLSKIIMHYLKVRKNVTSQKICQPRIPPAQKHNGTSLSAYAYIDLGRADYAYEPVLLHEIMCKTILFHGSRL